MLRSCVLLSTVCLVAQAQTGGPLRSRQAAPSVVAILARAKAAAGGSAWDRIACLESRGRLSSGGMQGTLQAWEDVVGGRSLSRYDLGALRGSQGFDGRGGWSQNESGDVMSEEGQGAQATAYLTARAYWFPQRAEAAITDEGIREGHFQVLKVHLQGTRTLELWLDTATWLLDRVVSSQDGSVSTTFYSDYREVSGVKLPFRECTPGPERKLDSITDYASITANPNLAEGFFQRPEAKLDDFGLEAGLDSAQVPLEFTLNHIFVQARVNGKGPYRFFLDTGGVNILTPSLVKALGLPSLGAIEGGGVGGTQETFGLTRVDLLQVGQAWMKGQNCYVIPSIESISKQMGLQVDGILGYELLRRFITRVDYDARTLTLSRPAGWVYRGSGAGVPFVFNGHHPRVQGALDGIPCALDIDTGSGATLDVYAPFAGTHQLREKATRAVKTVTGMGAGGEVTGHVIRARELRVGGVQMASPVIGLSAMTSGAFADSTAAGNVGQGFLHRFNLTFDYPHQMIYFEKNRDSGKPDHYRLLGIRGDSKDPGLLAEVHAGTVAQRAGLKPGDRILAVDGRSIDSLSPMERTELLMEGEPGTRVELKIRSGAQERLVALVREDTL